jgi:hypothetical protein
MRDIPPQRFGMAGAGRTTAFQLAVALGIAVSVAIVGRPTSDRQALDHHRTNWLVGALLHVALMLLFAFAYPRRSADVAPATPAPALH